MSRNNLGDAIADLTAMIGSVLVSPNELDSNMESANVVDGLFAIARAVQSAADALALAGDAGRGASGSSHGGGLVRLPLVMARTGKSRASIQRAVRDGEFPAPVRTGARSVAWREADLAQWVAARPQTTGRGK